MKVASDWGFQAIRILREEKEKDDKLRQQYNDKWGRTASDNLTQQLREDQTKYQSLLERATQADAKVKSQFEANVDSMKVLSLPKVKLVIYHYYNILAPIK